MYERYCKLRDKKQYKDSDVARLTGISKSTFSDWKAGRGVPKTDKIHKIAEVLGVPADYLITGDPKHLYFAYARELEATKEEMEIIKAFRNADDLTQQMILRLLGLNQDSDSLSSKEA